MVKGIPELRALHQRIPRYVEQEVRAQLEKEARQIVAEMTFLKPLPGIAIEWTWGEVPAQAQMLGTVARASKDRISIKIYALAGTSEHPLPIGFPAVARWFEHGTAERVQKTTGKSTGRIVASPFFFPVHRANKTRVRGNLSRAASRAFRKANQQ